MKVILKEDVKKVGKRGQIPELLLADRIGAKPQPLIGGVGPCAQLRAVARPGNRRPRDAAVRGRARASGRRGAD